MSSSATEKIIIIICRHSPHCTYSHRSARTKICFLEINCQIVRGILFSYGVRDNHSLIFQSKQKAFLVEFFLAIVRTARVRRSYDSRFCYQFVKCRDKRRSGETERGREIGQSIFMFIIYIYIYIYMYVYV